MESAFRITAGFESEFGPGFAINYFQFDNDSDDFNFASDGLNGAAVGVFPSTGGLSSLVANNPGETLSALHSLEIHSTSVYAFKAIKFKRAYVNGRFGIQITSIEQVLESSLTDAFGTETGTLSRSANIDAFGPRFGIDYVRRIGHTPAQLIASSTTSLLFGDRDEFVANSFTGEQARLGADEFLTVFDIFFGVQAKQIRGEKRNTTMRVGFVNQSWLGGGTAVDPNGDFGFQGLSITLGFNR